MNDADSGGARCRGCCGRWAGHGFGRGDRLDTPRRRRRHRRRRVVNSGGGADYGNDTGVRRRRRRRREIRTQHDVTGEPRPPRSVNKRATPTLANHRIGSHKPDHNRFQTGSADARPPTTKTINLTKIIKKNKKQRPRPKL